MSSASRGDEALVVRRRVSAAPAAVFAAWTEPAQLLRWWGPAGVECTNAEVDLRVGGGFRLANQLPEGEVVWISGEYHEVDPPRRLRYSWVVEDSAEAGVGDVTVTFDAVADGTEIVVTHVNIATASLRDSHRAGWEGCLDGLAEVVIASRDNVSPPARPV